MLRLKNLLLLKRLIAFIFLLGFFLSCTPTHSCVDNSIHPAFINFLPSDIHSFILRAYEPNNNFQHLVDTFLITNNAASIYAITNDTTIVYINDSNPLDAIKPGYDWQIYLPVKNRIIQISNIKSTQVDGKGRVCFNPIYSFEVDGKIINPKPVQTSQFYTSGYMVYIHN